MLKVITLSETLGCCRWCRCTQDEPCPGGCGWANRAQTLCTACVPLEAALATAAGRRELAEFLHENGFLVPRDEQLSRRREGRRRRVGAPA